VGRKLPQPGWPRLPGSNGYGIVRNFGDLPQGGCPKYTKGLGHWDAQRTEPASLFEPSRRVMPGGPSDRNPRRVKVG
jgi:hypothetical protein